MEKTKVKPVAGPEAPANGEFSLIPQSRLLEIYAAMLKCRAIARALPGSRRRALLNSEAVTAGSVVGLQPSDAISPAPSDLTPCALKGVRPGTLLGWWSTPLGRMPSVAARAHIIPPSASTAARLEAAWRLASHFRAATSTSVVVVFSAPAVPRSRQTSSSALSDHQLQLFFHQAAAQKLPILFVRQAGSAAEELVPAAEACGMPGMVVDRDDAVAVYRVVFEALSHARRGNGPTLIECRPWPARGRAAKFREVRGTIRKMEHYLAGKGIAYSPVKDRIERQLAGELDGARFRSIQAL